MAPEILIVLPPARAASASSRQWVSRWLLVAVTTWMPRRSAATASSAARCRTPGVEGTAWTNTRAPVRSNVSPSGRTGPHCGRGGTDPSAPVAHWAVLARTAATRGRTP